MRGSAKIDSPESLSLRNDSQENQDRIQKVLDRHKDKEQEWSSAIKNIKKFRYKQTMRDINTTKKLAGRIFKIHESPSIVRTILEQQNTSKK